LLFAFLFPSAYGLYQLWFGYTEVYALVALGWALVILVYLLVLDQKIRLVWASILSAIVYLFYIGNLLILPPYVLLMVVCIWRQPHRRDRFSQVILNLVVFCVTLTLCLYLVQGINVVQLWDSNRLELQARGNPSNSIFYNIEGLLSQQHLGDFTNEWILIDATGLMLTIISPALWFLFRQSGQFNVNARVWLLGTIAVSYVAYSFIMTPILGYPKDWDLFSYIALFTALFGFYIYLLSQDQMPGSRLVYGGLAMSGWVHLVATLLPLLAASGALDSQEMAQWIVEKSSANHVFLAPLLSEDAMITSVVRSEKYRSFESRNTVVLPSRSGGMDAVYIFPGEQEKKMQKLAEWLGALGALEKGAWRSGSALLYRVPVQNLPDSLDPWRTLSKGGAFLQPQSKQIAIWENGIQMLGHSLEIGDSQGRNVIVRLYLRTLRKQNTNYTFSIKVRDSLGNVAGQDDKWTGNNSYGTQQWDIGDIVIEEFYPGLDTCLPGGKYTTTLEIYNAETMQIATLEGSTENLSVLESPGAMPLWACASP
jgi:hypothetical protein